MKLCSDKMSLLNSDIRGKNYYAALDLEKKGEKVLKLNTGNPAAFGFQMSEKLRASLFEKIDQAVGYCDVRGMHSARQAIMDYHKSKGLLNFSFDDIFIGNGISEIASMVATATVNPGDEILMPLPCYSLWINEVILHGGVPVFYRCDENDHWNPEIDHIKSLVTNKTKAIVVINPNNPTGVLYSDEILLEIAEIARQNKIMIWADEIYDRLVFDGKKHTSIAALAPDVTCITMNGLSKSHCLCGFRSGWMVISGSKEDRTALGDALIRIASMRLCANSVMQTIIPDALLDTEYTENMIREGGRLFEQRKATCDALDQIGAISYVKNDAAFYVFPKIKKEFVKYQIDSEFANKLLMDKHILIVPGSGFGWKDPDHFRIVMLPQKDILGQAVLEIGNFIEGK